MLWSYITQLRLEITLGVIQEHVISLTLNVWIKNTLNQSFATGFLFFVISS